MARASVATAEGAAANCGRDHSARSRVRRWAGRRRVVELRRIGEGVVGGGGVAAEYGGAGAGIGQCHDSTSNAVKSCPDR